MLNCTDFMLDFWVNKTMKVLRFCVQAFMVFCFIEAFLALIKQNAMARDAFAEQEYINVE